MKRVTQYRTRTGAGGVASLRLLSWAACWGSKAVWLDRKHAKVWPLTGPYFLAAPSRQKILEIKK